jgi:hypothetical protein
VCWQFSDVVTLARFNPSRTWGSALCFLCGLHSSIRTMGVAGSIASGSFAGGEMDQGAADGRNCRFGIGSESAITPAIYWQAIYSRDPRFDGRFFLGAATTGLYCRNICPVPFAKPRNILVFDCAAAAESAGFRPCKRCQPQAAPGTPA